MPTPFEVTSTVTDTTVWQVDNLGAVRQQGGILLASLSSPPATERGYTQLFSPDGETLALLDASGVRTNIATATAGGNQSVTGDLAVGGNLSVTGIGQDIFKTKATLTSRNTTVTPAADPHLTTAVVANATYFVTCPLAWTNGGGGFRANWTGPAAASMVWTDNDGVGVGTLAGNVTFSATTGTTLTGTLVTGANAGTFALQWAQSTSNAADTTLLAGCSLWLRRMA